MPRWTAVLLAVMAFWCSTLESAVAGSRTALVIGNGAYHHVSHLPNPTRDAGDMAAALRSIGFSVKELQNVGKNDFEAALSDFSEEAVGADFAIVYFAGHGIEVNHQNYLIPTDARLETDRRLRFEAISLDHVLGTLDDVDGIRMVLLDACRNNPFAASMRMSSPTRSVGRGFSPVEAVVSGTVISYSAKAGTVAADGTGRNSPFAAALLANITKPGLEIQFLLREVRDHVLTLTDGAQEPFISASLGREAIYLVPPAASGDSSSIGNKNDNVGDRDLEFWQWVKDTSDPRLLRAYIDKFPKGTFVPLALARIKILEDTPKKAKTPKTKPVDSTSQTKKAQPAAPQEKTTRTLSTKSCREGNKELCRINCNAGVARACRKLKSLGG